VPLSGKPLPPAVWEVAVASLLILARAWIYPVSGLWRDWFTIVCAFWIFSAVASKSKAWPYVAAGVMTGLLALYGWGQLGLLRSQL
jgi:hypothetical protein